MTTRDAGFAVSTGPEVEVRRVGIVGCGRIGRMHAAILAESPGFVIAGLAVAPVDGYGVGTSLVTGSGAPTAALVYKLVARAQDASAGAPLRPVAKRSVGKPGRGGRKWAVRHVNDRGTAVAELVLTEPPDPGPADRVLLRQLVQGGESVGAEPMEAARARHRRAVAELPAHALQLSRGYPAIPTVFGPDAEDSSIS